METISNAGHNQATARGHTRSVSAEDLPLQKIYRWERECASTVLLTQPLEGQVYHWTWAEAVREARAMAAYLKAQNWPEGSRIAIVSKNCAWWIIADFAIWLAGHVSVPMYASLRSVSFRRLLEHCQPVACFVGSLEDSSITAEIPRGEVQCIALPNAASGGDLRWKQIVAAREPLTGEPVRPGDATATIIYTSGTTGEPKGAMHSFAAISLMGQSVCSATARDPKGDRILSYLPLAHIAERAIVEASAIQQPLHIFFAEKQQTFLADLERARPTIFFTVPRLLLRFQQGVFAKIPERKLDRLLRIPLLGRVVGKRVVMGLGLDSVRLAASGSAPLPVSLLHWYRRIGLNLIEGYGMTETGITHVPLPGQAREGYVGTASGASITKIGEDGEILIQGPMNMLGYFRNPEATALAFTGDGYFHTGDRGETDEQGRLRIVGRLKEEFKTSKGKYVAPAQIEKLLGVSPFLEAVCVLGEGRIAPFAIVVLTPEQKQNCQASSGKEEMERALQALLTAANTQLEHYQELRYLVVASGTWTIENGFLTPTLKVRRAVVETTYRPYFDEWEQHGRPIFWETAR